MGKKSTGPDGIQERFLAEVARLWPLAKGSLAEVRKPCIRSGCAACASGEKHRAFLFTFSEAGRRRCLYVPKDLVPVLREALDNGRRLEALLTELGPALIRAYRAKRDEAPSGKASAGAP